jgi:winged helix-turn helix protein
MEERIALSGRERERLKVLHEIGEGYLSQMEASRRLGLSTRQVRRLEGRVKAEGDRGLVHRLRGRPSNRKIREGTRQRMIREVKRRYSDFGPTLAAEKLVGLKGAVSRETLRKWMIEAGLWRARRKRLGEVHVWRERRAAFGELVMMDSSPFRWLEGRGPELHLIALIDDATSRIWGRFVEHDSTLENLRTLRGWLQRYGRPLALYTDKDSVFFTTRPAQWAEQLEGKETARTQFGRALEELGIRPIPAHSPQAKGRIERLFGTLQDRLVKELRLAKVHTLEQANRFLEEFFIPFWTQRFTVLPRSPRNAHRALQPEHCLEQILSVRERRSLAPDYTLRWRGQTWGIPRQEVRAGLRAARVEIEQRLEGTIWVRFRGSYLSLRPCPVAPRFSTSPSGLRPPGLAEKPRAKSKSKYIPPPDHPWRRTFLFGQKADISTLR